jgi:hypothetical protein
MRFCDTPDEDGDGVGERCDLERASSAALPMSGCRGPIEVAP